MIIGQEKPPLSSLVHYGVLGMKWGKTQKYTGREIKTARRELQIQSKNYRIEARKVNKLNEDSVARKVGEAKLEKMNRDYLNNPARVAATRMSKGEQFGSLLFSQTGVGAGIAIAAIATSSIASRRIQAKQEAGAYNKVKGRRKAGGFVYSSGALISSGGALSTALLSSVGKVAMTSISARAAANNTARLSRTNAIGAVASKLKFAKKSRGAFKITTMK